MAAPKMFDLAGDVAVVTGGNGGIERGIALGLAEAGAAVAILARNEEKNRAVVAELQSRGVPVPPPPAPQAPPTCDRCRSGDVRYSWAQDRLGRRQIRRECARCVRERIASAVGSEAAGGDRLTSRR